MFLSISLSLSPFPPHSHLAFQRVPGIETRISDPVRSSKRERSTPSRLLRLVASCFLCSSRDFIISGSSDRERVLLHVDAKIGSFDDGRRPLNDNDDDDDYEDDNDNDNDDDDDDDDNDDNDVDVDDDDDDDNDDNDDDDDNDDNGDGDDDGGDDDDAVDDDGNDGDDDGRDDGVAAAAVDAARSRAGSSTSPPRDPCSTASSSSSRSCCT
ncbi:hypothetical protein K0M31_008671 [Melipona bicolor]|uniref:Uncharacterized protein n=1 Tax=Melipona bicolor TaxID=60889 RepID=A0AA40FQE4_9HYME|nr:hypothetical protein K0M31_008671 [Melipona bicolor]